VSPDGLLLVGLGTVLLAVTSADMILTTVRVGRRAGPVTRVVSESTWRLISRMARGSGPPLGTGAAITFLVVTIWLSTLLFGWYLVFTASPEAVVNSSTHEPADGWARLYYTAFTISTLGIGDYAPAGAVWQVLTGMAATTGFAMATLVITYVAALNSAVATKRQFARTTLGLGRSPTEMLVHSWSGDRFEGLDEELASLARDVHGLAEQQLTYPLLVYFGTRERDAAAWPALNLLSETLYVLEHHVAEEARPAPLPVGSLRRAIDSYLDLFSDVRTSTSGEPPMLVDLRRMSDAGIPLTAVEPGPAALRRRRRLQALLQHQGWAWDSAVEGDEQMPGGGLRPSG
jgi:Ion channel